MRLGVWRLSLVALCYLIMLYLRDILLNPPIEEEDITFSFRLNDDVKNLRKQLDDKTYDTAPFRADELIQPFFRYKELYKVSPKYSLTTCQIEKTTSLLKDAIFCFLKNPWKFRANKRRISTEEYFTRFCRDEYLAKNYSIVGKSLGRIKFAVLRDPIDRFLSGFVDKCIMRPKDVETRCFACKGNLGCFIEAFYRKLQEVYRTNDNTYHFEVAHMAPQTWYCNFKEHLDDYIFVRYQKCTSGIALFAQEIDKILRKARVPEDMRSEIYGEILVGRTPHSTRGSGPRYAVERELFNNRTLLDTVMKMFYYDYKIWGIYTRPQLITPRSYVAVNHTSLFKRRRRLRTVLVGILFSQFFFYIFLYVWYLTDINNTPLHPVFNEDWSVSIGPYRWSLNAQALDPFLFNESSVFPPFHRYREYFQDIPKYRLCTCFIEKVMSTIRDGIFCYLNDPVDFVAHNRRISTENYVNRFCSGTDRPKCSYETERSVRRVKFAVVRDPIDRFLSGYADKCYPKQLPLPPERCFGCEQNISCFVETLLNKLRDLIRNDSATEYMETSHFAPQTWYCNFKENLHDFIIIKHESGRRGIRNIASQFDDIFRLAGVPLHHRAVIRKEMLVGRTIHTTSGTTLRRHVEKLLYSNRTLLRMVTHLYYYDFIVFGFEFPNFTEISRKYGGST